MEPSRIRALAKMTSEYSSPAETLELAEGE